MSGDSMAVSGLGLIFPALDNRSWGRSGLVGIAASPSDTGRVVPDSPYDFAVIATVESRFPLPAQFPYHNHDKGR